MPFSTTPIPGCVCECVLKPLFCVIRDIMVLVGSVFFQSKGPIVTTAMMAHREVVHQEAGRQAGRKAANGEIVGS